MRLCQGMYSLDLTLNELADNLALDEALLLQAEQGGPEVLRVWEWPTAAVVLGAASRLADDVHLDACRGARVPWCRRSSGGGTVLLGRGCLLFSLVLALGRHPALEHVLPSFRFILDKTRAALQPLLPGLELAGTSDLSWKGYKISGNSQQRKRSHLLHHGTLLYAFDIAQVGRFLKQPLRQPAYRQGRGHDGFLANVPVASEELQRRLHQAWQASTPLPAWPQNEVQRLVRDKFACADWLKRR